MLKLQNNKLEIGLTQKTASVLRAAEGYAKLKGLTLALTEAIDSAILKAIPDEYLKKDQPQFDARLKQWVIQAQNQSLLVNIPWEISDEDMLACLDKVGADLIYKGSWVLARWADSAHKSGNSILIQAPDLVNLNRAATRGIQRSLLATLYGQNLAFFVGLPDSVSVDDLPVKKTVARRVAPSKGIEGPKAIPLEKAKPREIFTDLGVGLDFHFAQFEAKKLGFKWALTGPEFKELTDLRRGATELKSKSVRLYPKKATEAISIGNAQWGSSTALAGLTPPEYQGALDEMAGTVAANPGSTDSVWEIAGSAVPDELNLSDKVSQKLIPDYEKYVNATPELIVDWFKSNSPQWDWTPLEIKEAYIYFKHWAQGNLRATSPVCIPPGFNLDLAYFSKFIENIGGLSRIGGGKDRLLPIRINRLRPYCAGNIVLTTRKNALKLHNRLRLLNTPNKHEQVINELKRGVAGFYYCDVNGNYYGPRIRD